MTKYFNEADRFEPVHPNDEKKFFEEFKQWLQDKPAQRNSDQIKEIIAKTFKKKHKAEIINAGMNLKDGVCDIEMKYKGMDFDILVFPRDLVDQVRLMEESEGTTKH